MTTTNKTFKNRLSPQLLLLLLHPKAQKVRKLTKVKVSSNQVKANHSKGRFLKIVDKRDRFLLQILRCFLFFFTDLCIKVLKTNHDISLIREKSHL
mmetsp:Transcript_9074/g.9842  ORF Transcript_9074/g.9842 Transcript_9074/m.9842 type:complete len:96 (-) Transcript_9074:31-318(-)